MRNPKTGPLSDIRSFTCSLFHWMRDCFSSPHREARTGPQWPSYLSLSLLTSLASTGTVADSEDAVYRSSKPVYLKKLRRQRRPALGAASARRVCWRLRVLLGRSSGGLATEVGRQEELDQVRQEVRQPLPLPRFDLA